MAKRKQRVAYAVRKMGTKHKWLADGGAATCGADGYTHWGEAWRRDARREANRYAEEFGGVVVEVPEPE